MAAASFVARISAEASIRCETCIDRCRMEALSMADDHAVMNSDRCIGCNLCVSACPSYALSLERKPHAEQVVVPKNQMEAHAIRLDAREKARAGFTQKLIRHQKL